MIQNIIVALIVVAAIVYAGYSVYRSVSPGNKPGNACGGCTGCELKNMKNTCESVPDTGSGVNNKDFSRKFLNTNLIKDKQLNLQYGKRKNLDLKF